ncbi:hypothetical protein ACHAQH_002014 [Verticillium albo-atrum]
MVKKQRTPTICEWALGFTVEEIHAQQQLRRQRREGRSSQERFRVEISTDDESEEDTLKITYPRSGGNKTTGTKVKRVRFQKEPAKSAIKNESDSEACGTEPSESETKKKADSAKSSDSSKSSKKTSGDKTIDEASVKTKNAKKKKSKAAEQNDSSDSGEEAPKSKQKQGGKKDKSNASELDDSSDSEDAKSKKKEKSKKKANKNDKSSGKGGEVEDDASDEGSESDEEAPKKKKKKDNKSKKDAKNKGKKDQEVVRDNNVGPTIKKNKEMRDDKIKGSKKGPSSVGSSVEKLRPEGFPPPHPRLPNLIMPIRAEVLQVEHTIEGVEDPRPNAFHSGEHGVVRVYHGPAYGNPYGTLYPRRDLKKAALPAGMPHPASNPWQQGFSQPSNPGDMQHHGHSPWNSVPFNSRPGGPRPSGPDPVGSAPAYPPWAHDAFAGRQGAHGSPKPMSPAFMSGALNGGVPPMTAGDKDRSWDTNVGPPVGAKQISPSLPININMFSYGARPDPWTKEGRQRYANLGKAPEKSRYVFPPGTRDYWDGSLQNNAGPAIYDRNEPHWGSNKGSNNSNNQAKAKHQDLSWDPPSIKTAAANDGQPQNVNGNSDWAQTDGNGDTRNGRQMGSKKEIWDANNGASSGETNGNGWSATSNANGNGNGNDSHWNSNWDNNNTNTNWTTGSNNSKGSKTSNRSVAKPQGDNVNWGGSSNNVGFSSGNSNKSGGSGGSKKSNRSQTSNKATEDWSNNAGPADGPKNSAGDGGAWGATASGDGWNKNDNGGNNPPNTMPGAWDSAPNTEQNGGYTWGDTSAAQVVPNSQW